MAIGTTLKSAAITNLDSTPIVQNNSGVAGPYRKNSYDGYVTTGANNDAGTKYILVRVKSDVKVKNIFLESAAQGASLAVDVGVWYADDTRYLAPGNALLAGTAVSQAFFASAVVLTNAYGPTEITNESGTYTIDKRGQPLWQAAGLSADPGGFFDIVATTTASGTGGALLGLSVSVAENNA
jgi:hypothetical protein